MNTSMTINATAAWLLALYVADGGQGVDPAAPGTTQNDIVKEYLSRGTYIFPPGPSLRLTVDMVAWTCHAPECNPINVCSYHLQEAGATPVQEMAYAQRPRSACSTRRAAGQVDDFTGGGRAHLLLRQRGVRFVEETCKMRAFTRLWDRICAERYGVEDPKLRRFRYGVQVNSLGLTEAQPENNVQRIVLETLGVTLSKTPGRGPCSCRRGTRRSGCPAPGTSSGHCASSRSSPTRRTCSSTETSSRVASDRGQDGRVRRGATAELDDVQALGGAFGAIDELKRASCAARPSGYGASSPASRRWSG